jgi:rod shape-determining protein MreD
VNLLGIARVSFVIALAVVIQQALLDAIRFGGVHPDLLVLLPVLGGYIAGPERGAVFGFTVGLVTDLFLPTPFGLSALVGSLVGFGVGMATAGLVRNSWWLPLVVAGGATAGGLVLYAILLSVIGQTQVFTTSLPASLAVVPLSAVVLTLPAIRLVAWAVPPPTTGQGANAGIGTW